LPVLVEVDEQQAVLSFRGEGKDQKARVKKLAHEQGGMIDLAAGKRKPPCR
jgi:hypothetical protein